MKVKMNRANRQCFRKAVSVIVLLCIVAAGFCGCKKKAPTDVPSAPSATGTDGMPVASDGSVQDSPALYTRDPAGIVTMYLTVREGNQAENTNHSWADVNAFSTAYYTEKGIDRNKCEGILQVVEPDGTVSFGAGVTTPNTIINVRGATSSVAAQKSYKVKIMKGKGTWDDQKTISLNKHYYDHSRIRNKLSYDLMAKDPTLLGCRTTFVHLYVKDETSSSTSSEFKDYGLFTQCEQVNSSYLRTHGFDEFGQLYKATSFEFYRYEDIIKNVNDPGYDKAEFEKHLEIKGDEDHTDLIAMLKALNDYSQSIGSVLDEYFDKDNVLSWMAFQYLIGNDDTVSQNFYIFSPSASKKFYFISWDNDGAWNYTELVEKMGTEYNYTRGISYFWPSILTRRIVSDDTLRAEFSKKVDKYYKWLRSDETNKLIEQYSKITKGIVLSSPDADKSNLVKEYDETIEGMYKQVDFSYEMLSESLKHPMPFYTNDPIKSGNNVTIEWDASFDFNGEGITYTFQIATDPEMKNLVVNQTNLKMPFVSFEALKDGSYFMKIFATNESGKTGTLMSMYEDINDKAHPGVCKLYVNGDSYEME